MFKDLRPSALYMGILAAFVGYAASFAIVLAGVEAVGATREQAATALFFATLGMGVCSIWLPLMTRIPAAVAWSTPGAAFLAATALLPGGFAEAIGALIICAVLIVLTGLVPWWGRAVAAIPKQIASALLAGVLLKLCFAPALALGEIPWLVLPVIVAWVLGLAWKKLLAMPLAVLAFILVLIFAIEVPEGGLPMQASIMPSLEPIMPVFSISSAVSVGLPLYLVTMAGQNIPGFAVLELNGYGFNRQGLLRNTGFVSLMSAPFGAVPVNMSAITAAMMAGEDAGPDPATRYWAAVTSGLIYCALAFAAGLVTFFAGLAPAALITSVAGLALIPALVGALRGAFNNESQLEAPALTFLLSASGMTLLGVSGAFWGVLLGALVWLAKRLRAA